MKKLFLLIVLITGSAFAQTPVFWQANTGLYIHTGSPLPITDNLSGTNRLKNDFEAPMLYTFKIAGKEPTPTIMTNGCYELLFPGNGNTAAAGSIHINHQWREGSSVMPHVHVVQQGVGISNVVLKLNWAWINRYTNGHVQVNGDTQVGVSTITNAAQDYPQAPMWNFAEIYPTNMISSSQFSFTLERMCDDAADTNANGLFIMQFDVHGEVYRLGEKL